MKNSQFEIGNRVKVVGSQPPACAGTVVKREFSVSINKWIYELRMNTGGYKWEVETNLSFFKHNIEPASWFDKNNVWIPDSVKIPDKIKDAVLHSLIENLGLNKH